MTNATNVVFCCLLHAIVSILHAEPSYFDSSSGDPHPVRRVSFDYLAHPTERSNLVIDFNQDVAGDYDEGDDASERERGEEANNNFEQNGSER